MILLSSQKQQAIPFSYNHMRHWDKKVNEYKQAKLGDTVRFQSGMTSEQKYNSIAESVLSNMPQVEVAKGCPMHPKISKKCRKCQDIERNALTQQQSKEADWKLQQNFPEIIKWNTSFFKSHFNQKLQKNIEESNFYKSKLKAITNIKDLSHSISPDQISIEAYTPNSNDIPTEFIAYLYRLAELHPTKQQINIMLKANNVNVRCLILLYLRVYVDPYMVYACINHSFKDNKLLSVITIGEYAMRLFDQSQLNHGGFRIPRLPIKIQKEIDKKIAQINQKREKQFQRQRSRSRERKRRYEQQEGQRQANQEQISSSSSSSSSSQDDQKPLKMQALKSADPTAGLTLKQKIRLIQQKRKAEQRRKALLESYKAEKVQNLQSEQDEYNENDQIQKFKMG